MLMVTMMPPSKDEARLQFNAMLFNHLQVELIPVLAYARGV